MASFTLHGIPVSKGIAIGRAHLLRSAAMDVQHYLVAQELVEFEVERLTQAIQQAQTELQNLRADLPADAPTELGAFLDVHVLILSDPMICEDTLHIIRERHYNAEWALATQVNALSDQFDEFEDEYLRQRKADIQQVAERVLKILTGNASPLPKPMGIDEENANIIVVARDISPADMMQFRHVAFTGFVTDEGGKNSHTAIVSRSLGIPAVVGLANASRIIEQDDWIIIDSDAGVVIVAPTALVIEQYRDKQNQLQKQRKKLLKLKKTPAITQDGVEIHLLANIELPSDTQTAIEMGSGGVGLFRTEFLFMQNSNSTHAETHEQHLPTEEEQFLAYQAVAQSMKGKPVTIRTLDVGADKPLNHAAHNILNPAMGLRAIRYCLKEPDIFKTQLRAILRASVFGDLRILIPMLSHASEIQQSLQLIEEAKNELRASGISFNDAMPIGAMIEIPAAALAMPLFVSYFDFFSVGTNDLIQYTLAIDRADHEVAHLYDDTHPAVLQLLNLIIQTANQANRPVAICGGMAGDIQLTRLLIAMGYRELSMPSALIPEVKQEILLSNLSQLTCQAQAILQSYDVNFIRQALAMMRSEVNSFTS